MRLVAITYRRYPPSNSEAVGQKKMRLVAITYRH